MDVINITEELYKAVQERGLIAALYDYFQKSVQFELGYSQKCCDTPIEDISLSVRSLNSLRRAGISTVGEAIRAINEDKLLEIRNLGLKSRSEIRVKICEYGYECLSERSRKEFLRKTVEKNCLSGGK